MKYKIMFHSGDSIDMKTKAKTGFLVLGETALEISGDESICIAFSEITDVDLFRLHGLGRMIKIQHSSGTLFVSVVRFVLFGYFATVNFFRTGQLNNELKAAVEARR